MKIYIVLGIIAVVVIVAVLNIIRVFKIRKNGIETDAVISRIEEQDSSDGDDYTVVYIYYISYRTQEGKTVEAKLNHAPGRTRVGDQVRIKYLPEKPNHAIIVK